MSGHVTTRLFENLNQPFHRTSKVNTFITAVKTTHVPLVAGGSSMSETAPALLRWR